jgi:hypothetical protein
MHGQRHGMCGTDPAAGTGDYSYFAFQSLRHFCSIPPNSVIFQQDIQNASGWGIDTGHRVVGTTAEQGFLSKESRYPTS